jgi:hypothetical protein
MHRQELADTAAMAAVLQWWLSSHSQSSNHVVVGLLPSMEHMRQPTTSPTIMELLSPLTTVKATMLVAMVPLMSRATAVVITAGIVLVSTELVIAGISIDRRIELVTGAVSMEVAIGVLSVRKTLKSLAPALVPSSNFLPQFT